MGRHRLSAHDDVFWDSVRAQLEAFHAAGQSWTAIARSLGVGKQTLTGFRKRRTPALDAEALLKLCTVLRVPLTFQGQTVRAVDTPEVPTLQLHMEFDDSFELRADPLPQAILSRKPPNRVSYIGVRIEQITKKPGSG